MKAQRMPSKRLQALADDLNTSIAHISEFLTSDENSSIAEWVQSFGYGEMDGLHFDRLSTEGDELVKRLTQYVGRKSDEFRDTLQACCDLEPVSGYGYADNEIFGASLGECEEQLDDDLSKRIHKLNDADYSALRRMINAYLPEKRRDRDVLIYLGHDSDRWAMCLNEERLAEALERMGAPALRVPEPTADTRSWLERRQSFQLIQGGAQ